MQYNTYLNDQKKIEESLRNYGLSYAVGVELKEYSSIEMEDKVIKPSSNRINKELSKSSHKTESVYDLISEVYEGQREAKLRTKIFLVENTPTKNNTMDRLVVYIHDESGAITFTQYLDNDEKIKKAEDLKEGICIEVIADVKSDMRNELYLQAKAFSVIDDWLMIYIRPDVPIETSKLFDYFNEMFRIANTGCNL